MKLDPETASVREVYSTMIRAITPRPIAWVSTQSKTGISNLAPFSFFSGVCSQPAALCFSPVNRPDGSKKDTVINIEQTGEFVVNVVPFAMAKQMAKSAAELPFEESEIELAELTEQQSVRVKPPSIVESPIQFECELIQIVHVGEGPNAANLIVGKILLINIHDEVLSEDGKIDPLKLDALGRMGGRAYCRTNHLLELERG